MAYNQRCQIEFKTNGLLVYDSATSSEVLYERRDGEKWADVLDRARLRFNAVCEVEAEGRDMEEQSIKEGKHACEQRQEGTAQGG